MFSLLYILSPGALSLSQGFAMGGNTEYTKANDPTKTKKAARFIILTGLLAQYGTSI